MKIEANFIEDVVVVDLTNYEAEGITDSDQKERTRNPSQNSFKKETNSSARKFTLDKSKIQCFKCKKHGYYASKCPQKDQEKK